MAREGYAHEDRLNKLLQAVDLCFLECLRDAVRLLRIEHIGPRSRNFEARNERIEKGAVVKRRRDQRCVERGPGECWQRKAQGHCWKGYSCSFRHDENYRAKSMSKFALPSESQVVEVHQEERVSEAGVHLGRCLDNRPEITSKVSARGHLVIFGIFLSVNFIEQNQDVNSVINVLLRTGRLNISPAKTEEEW